MKSILSLLVGLFFVVPSLANVFVQIESVGALSQIESTGSENFVEIRRECVAELLKDNLVDVLRQSFRKNNYDFRLDKDSVDKALNVMGIDNDAENQFTGSIKIKVKSAGDKDYRPMNLNFELITSDVMEFFESREEGVLGASYQMSCAFQPNFLQSSGLGQKDYFRLEEESKNGTSLRVINLGLKDQ